MVGNKNNKNKISINVNNIIIIIFIIKIIFTNLSTDLSVSNSGFFCNGVVTK